MLRTRWLAALHGAHRPLLPSFHYDLFCTCLCRSACVFCTFRPIVFIDTIVSFLRAYERPSIAPCSMYLRSLGLYGSSLLVLRINSSQFSLSFLLKLCQVNPTRLACLRNITSGLPIPPYLYSSNSRSTSSGRRRRSRVARGFFQPRSLRWNVRVTRLHSFPPKTTHVIVPSHVY